MDPPPLFLYSSVWVSKIFFCRVWFSQQFSQPCKFNVFNLTHIWVISKLIFNTITETVGVCAFIPWRMCIHLNQTTSKYSIESPIVLFPYNTTVNDPLMPQLTYFQYTNKYIIRKFPFMISGIVVSLRKVNNKQYTQYYKVGKIVGFLS